jgi:hypothetical protein
VELPSLAVSGAAKPAMSRGMTATGRNLAKTGRSMILYAVVVNAICARATKVADSAEGFGASSDPSPMELGW